MVILEIILFKPGPIQVSYEYTLGILFLTSAFYISLVPLLAQGIEIHPGKYNQRTNKVKKIWRFFGTFTDDLKAKLNLDPHIRGSRQ